MRTFREEVIHAFRYGSLPAHPSRRRFDQPVSRPSEASSWPPPSKVFQKFNSETLLGELPYIKKLRADMDHY
jgi:hypothetical protein